MRLDAPREKVSQIEHCHTGRRLHYSKCAVPAQKLCLSLGAQHAPFPAGSAK